MRRFWRRARGLRKRSRRLPKRASSRATRKHKSFHKLRYPKAYKRVYQRVVARTDLWNHIRARYLKPGTPKMKKRKVRKTIYVIWDAKHGRKVKIKRFSHRIRA